MRCRRVTHTLSTIVVVWAVVGCSDFQRLERKEFLSRAAHIGRIESAQTTSFLGATTRAAYLEHWQAAGLFGTHTQVFWIPLDELADADVVRLRAGTHPWQQQRAVTGRGETR